MPEYPDTARLTHSRNTSSIIGSKERSVNIVSQPLQGRRPMSISAELAQPGPSPIALVHPPQGYTRPARVNTADLSGTPPEAVHGHQAHPAQAKDRTFGNETAAGAVIASPTRSHIEDTASVSNRRSSLFLPTSASHPPPVRQQQPGPAVLQPIQTNNYQAYKPFSSRYQVPHTIPEEGPASTTHPRKLSIDTSFATRSFLPGEQTRSQANGIPASLAAGTRS